MCAGDTLRIALAGDDRCEIRSVRADATIDEVTPPIALPDPPLRDGLVALRPWTADDVPTLLAGAADPLVHRFRYSLPSGAVAARAWVARVRGEREQGDRLELAITAAGDAAATALGSVSVAHLTPGDPPPTLAYWLAPAARGRGIGTAAVRLLVGWAFAQPQLDRLQLGVEIDNASSIRLAERCGFERVGPPRVDGVRRDGAPAVFHEYVLHRGSVDAQRPRPTRAIATAGDSRPPSPTR